MVVIPNGLDLPQVAEGTRAAVRGALGIPQDALVATRIGRWHPHKDYPLLLRAFAEVVAREPRAVLVAAGPGVQANAPEPRRLLAELGLAGQVHLLGERSDVTSLLAASDVVVSSSNGEGFPNTVAEAMAVGVPAVVTDVGSSAELVDATGWVVPPSCAPALATAVVTALHARPEERERRGAAARERIRSSYGSARMADAYASLHERLAGVRQSVE
jgi:glycosyltransferase involved in cell wall biosynthesis